MALEHLYDFEYLQRHPLARDSGPDTLGPGETEGQGLRRRVTAAIETLNPGPHVRFGTPQGRPYQLLVAHYVEGATIQEAANELGISRRQAHRDLRRGVEGVTAVLWTGRPEPTPQARPSAAQLTSVQEEVGRLGAHPQPTDIGSLVQSALDAVQPMARLHGVRIAAELPAEPVVVTADPMMARQVLISTISDAVSKVQSGDIRARLAADKEVAQLTLRYDVGSTATGGAVYGPAITQLVDLLGWTVACAEERPGERTVILCLSARCPTVLVIDDNEGLVELLDDYLTGQTCQVIAAFGGKEGLSLAQRTPPDAIVLDVMLPGMDGWELLQRLQNHPRTSRIPVIVCSVIDNPELAYALGASVFLPKPVARGDLLEALRQLSIV
jgi:CheY-like chemotaxis protein